MLPLLCSHRSLAKSSLSVLQHLFLYGSVVLVHLVLPPKFEFHSKDLDSFLVIPRIFA